MRLVLAALSLFAVACAAPPPAALEPFLAAGRFVPAGMQSFICTRDAPIPLVPGPWAPIVVMAGRDFQGPKDIGVGPSCTVWVADHGAGAEAARADSLRTYEVDGVRIAERDCWHFTAGYKFELWCTTVDDRFVLWATDPNLLGEALARNGDLRASLAPLGDLSWVPREAKGTLYLMGGAMVAEPGSPTVVVQLVDRLVLSTRGACHPGLAWMVSRIADLGESKAMGNGWTGRIATMWDPDSGEIEFWWATMFGFAIFI